MSGAESKDRWSSGKAYEPYVGRWSRPVAREFLAWLDLPPGGRWLDVGCGTGALTEAILTYCEPGSVTGIDMSEMYVEYAREHIRDPRAAFKVGSAESIPEESGSYDAVVSGLVLNFVPQPQAAVEEMKRVAKGGATVALYVWDYSGEMQLMRYFWDAAVELNPGAAPLDEGTRFPICKPVPLAELFRNSGFNRVETRAVDVPTVFRDFDDYWSPFLGGQGPAPGYAMSLGEEDRATLRDLIKSRLPVEADGSIPLMARAWAVRGSKE